MIKNPGYQPVSNDTLVIPKFADGDIFEPTVAEAFDWTLQGKEDDLIEYEVYGVKNDR
jgi:hypothetical protein